MERSVTNDLAEHLSTVAFEHLPQDVIDKAGDCLLDSIGCMTGGSRVDQVREAAEVVLAWGQSPDARVPGITGTYPAAIAAYASAQFANALDYDDTVLGVGHPGAAVIATALAIGQRQATSGKDLITAIVAGYDAAIRIGRAIKPSEDRARAVRGHTWAIFGSVAAASSLMRLNANQCRYALGFAAQHAPVPFVGKWYERPITALKNNYGWAAMGGIAAAEFASRGAVGNRDVLDGDNGFWTMASSDQWNPDEVSTELGTRFSITDVEFKPFAACRYTHTALDALQTVLGENEIQATAIDRIVVRAASRSQVFADYSPGTLLDAQFSLPYAISSTALGRELTSFDPHDADVATLAKSVEIVTDHGAESRASLAGLPATVEVHMRGGQIHVAHVEVPPGTPARALSRNQLDEKFKILSTPVIGSEKADIACQLIRGPVDQISAEGLAECFSPR